MKGTGFPYLQDCKMPLEKLKAWGGHVTNGQKLTIIFWNKYEKLCPFSQADGPGLARPSCG